MWETSDGIVPVTVFVAWLNYAGRRAVTEQLRQTAAVHLGAAGLVADKKGQSKIARAIRKLERLAEG